MAGPDAPSAAPSGSVGNVLLLRAPADKVSAWVGKGLVAAHVTPLGDWTAVTPAGTLAATAAPYQDARSSLAARPVSTALRPSVGFFVHGRGGVLVVQAPGWRTVKRWLVWDPDNGPMRVPRLPGARPADLAGAARVGTAALPAVVGAVRGIAGGPVAWLAGVHAALGLPGRALLVEPDAPRGALVEPSAKAVALFDRIAREEAGHRADLAAREPRPKPPEPVG